MMKCKKCDSRMVEDARLSSIVYDEQVKELLNEDGEILYEDLPDFVMFACRRCGYNEEIKLASIILGLQNKIVKQLLNTRLQVLFSTADRSIVDEANGVSFCGLCPGVVDDSGTCYNDVIKQCPIRKVRLKDDT